MINDTVEQKSCSECYGCNDPDCGGITCSLPECTCKTDKTGFKHKHVYVATQEIEGHIGVAENPGVWQDGAVITTRTHCKICGSTRTERYDQNTFQTRTRLGDPPKDWSPDDIHVVWGGILRDLAKDAERANDAEAVAILIKGAERLEQGEVRI